MWKRVLCMVVICSQLCGCGGALFEAVSPREDVYFVRGQWGELEELITTRYKGQEPPFKEFFELCNAQYELKEYSKAKQCLDGLVAKVEREGKAHAWFESYDSVPYELTASLYLDFGQYDKALTWSQKAVEISISRGVNCDYRMRALAVLGLSQAFLGQQHQAEATRKNISDTICFYSIAGITKRFALTRLDLAMGNYALITQASDEDLGSIQLKLIAGGDSLYMYELQNRFVKAKAQYMIGQAVQARQEYLRLLAIPQLTQSGTLHWSILYDLGRMASTEGRFDEAFGYLRRAIALIEAQRSNINTEAAKIGFIGDKQAVYAELISLLIKQGRLGEALEYVERGKSRALVDLLAERQTFAFQAQTGQADPTESLKLLASLEHQFIASGSRIDEKVRLRSAMTDLRRELDQRAPELASLITVAAPKAADIQAQLSSDEALLEFYDQGETLYAFTVTRDAIKAVKLDGKGLEFDVRALREAMSVRSETWRILAQKLHSRLITPVAEGLTKSKLIIVSHGALHYLPWSALTDGKQFLVDKASIQHLPSASVMQFLKNRKASTAKDMLLLGNPDLGDKAMNLPGAEAEAKAIKEIWPNSTMLLRKAATKAALTKAGQLFRVIHVAAHGEFVSDQPLASRLLLAPDGSDNGQLTAGDLYEMHLSADLVTLSACETGMGKVLSGDDVVGLTRGLLYAGANSIVASLWPVSDDETKFLMTSFYSNLRKMPEVEALRQAQLETKKKYPHPFYWSAFQLTGMGR